MGNQYQAMLKELERGKSVSLAKEIEGTTYIRRFDPDDRLILLGGGHVAEAVAKVADMLGFSITIVDDRIAFANSERFPMAEQIICDDFEKAIAELNIHASDYVCVVTRGHRYDAACLRAILPGTMPTYLGMIGSKKRVAGLLELLEEEGMEPEKLKAIHTPIGLPIGAQTPSEIAVSICAEMVAHRRRDQKKEKGQVLVHTHTDYGMLHFLAENNDPKALLLVIETEGSTPVKSGAVMAIDRLGKGYGTIGGGCGEAAVMGRARRIIGTGGSVVVPLDMTNEVAESQGMVCGGRMWVYIEDLPVDQIK